VLPLSFPALITTRVLAFREAWNKFNRLLALTQTPGNRTLPYSCGSFSTVLGQQPGDGAVHHPHLDPVRVRLFAD